MALRFLRWRAPLPGRSMALLAILRQRAAERRALCVIVRKPHDHLLDDAGLTRDAAHRLLAQSALHRLAERLRAGGR